MSQMLLLNPRKRARRAKSSARKTRRAGARRRRNPVPAGLARYMARRGSRTISRVRRVRRRRNPVALASVGRVSRARRYTRRRRNPISLGGTGRSMMAMLKTALIGGAGAVAVDVAMGQVNRFLPAALQRTPGRIGVGDAVKAVLTVFMGKMLAKPTRGLSNQMAQGALIVQAHQLIAGFVPAGMTLGYMSPARIVQGQQRVGPNRSRGGAVGAYLRPGSTPMLNGTGAYSRPGVSPLLSGVRGATSAQQREGVTPYY